MRRAWPIAPVPGRRERFDYEYRRCGSANVYLILEPLGGGERSRSRSNGPMLSSLTR